MSLISTLHYAKLIFRSLLLLSAAAVYTVNRVRNTGESFGGIEDKGIWLGLLWLLFFVEIMLRFFPSHTESMGCQKQFSKNYIPTEEKTPVISSTKSTLVVIASWVALNGAIGALYYLGIIDAGILVLIALAYSVCDMICILFFCPFQTWMMKNKCCTTCRIYNWDYAMMATPLIFINNPYAISMVVCSLLLLVRWEVALARHPERFSEATNCSLHCSSCKEKLCHHKKQLRSFLRKNSDNLRLRGNAFVTGVKTKAQSIRKKDK